jgi:hypothetical protein
MTKGRAMMRMGLERCTEISGGGFGLECFLNRAFGARRVSKSAKHRQARSVVKNNGKAEPAKKSNVAGVCGTYW